MGGFSGLELIAGTRINAAKQQGKSASAAVRRFVRGKTPTKEEHTFPSLSYFTLPMDSVGQVLICRVTGN